MKLLKFYFKKYHFVSWFYYNFHSIKSAMNKKEALECIRNEEQESVPKKFYKDKSIVLEAVKQNGQALEYADESLKKDPDIIKVVKK